MTFILGVITGILIVAVALILIGWLADRDLKRQMNYEERKRRRNLEDYSERNQHLNKK